MVALHVINIRWYGFVFEGFERLAQNAASVIPTYLFIDVPAKLIQNPTMCDP
jgi:hypothetical protein